METRVISIYLSAQIKHNPVDISHKRRHLSLPTSSTNTGKYKKKKETNFFKNISMISFLKQKEGTNMNKQLPRKDTDKNEQQKPSQKSDWRIEGDPSRR